MPPNSRGGRGQDDAAPAPAGRGRRAGASPGTASWRAAPSRAAGGDAAGAVPGGAGGAAADDAAAAVAVGVGGREPGAVAALHAAAADTGRSATPGN